MTEFSWDFRNSLPEGVSSQQLTVVQPTDNGLYIQTDTDGFLKLPPLPIPADTLTIRLSNVDTRDAALLWQTNGLDPSDYYQHTVSLPRGAQKDVVFPLHRTRGWNWKAPFMAFALPAGSEVIVESMTWRSYTLTEKLWNGFLSFWTPDSFKLYSINFLWGPLIAVTPDARASLYDALPPQAWSAMRLAYGAFAIVFGLGFALFKWRPSFGRHSLILLLTIAVATLWACFDLRMTMEIVSYVRDDWRTYVLAPADERTFRTHSSLYRVINRVDTLLGDDERYALLAENGTPIFANVRYALLPATPLREGESTDGVSAWIVLGLPGVHVVDGSLVAPDGTVLAHNGRLIERFDADSFLYRTSP